MFWNSLFFAYTPLPSPFAFFAYTPLPSPSSPSLVVLSVPAADVARAVLRWTPAQVHLVQLLVNLGEGGKVGVTQYFIASPTITSPGRDFTRRPARPSTRSSRSLTAPAGSRRLAVLYYLNFLLNTPPRPSTCTGSPDAYTGSGCDGAVVQVYPTHIATATPRVIDQHLPLPLRREGHSRLVLVLDDEADEHEPVLVLCIQVIFDILLSLLVLFTSQSPARNRLY